MAHNKDEVKGIQKTLNGFTKKWLEDVKPLTVDGEVGNETRTRIRWVKWYLGWGKEARKNTTHVDHAFLQLARDPHKTSRYPGNALNRARMKKRGEGRRKRQRAQTTGGGSGAAAVAWALKMVGKTETGQNDAPWLRAMERDILAAGIPLGWMIPGQPYCGFGCIWAWLKAGKKLPAGTVYTPNICPGADYGTRVSASSARPGDLVVFNFGSGGAKHVGLARGPAKGGVINCVEFNTSPGSGGSQSNGGGVWKRARPLGQVLCVKRPK